MHFPLKQLVVGMDNNLVTACYNMTLLEKRLILLFISKIDNNPDKPEILDVTKPYRVSVKDYSELYNIDYKTAKEELHECFERLYQQDLFYKNPDGSITRTRWIYEFPNYNKESHEVEIMISIGVVPLISELAKNFTQYKMKWLAKLQSYYSLRLYEVFYMELSRHRMNAVYVTYTIESLKDMLALEDKYPLFANFFDRVIKAPIAEINAKTNIHVSYEREGKKMYVKEGRKVVGIKFLIEKA